MNKISKALLVVLISSFCFTPITQAFWFVPEDPPPPPPPPPQDTTPPTLTIDYPAAGAQVSGIITIEATATDTGSGVDFVSAYIGSNQIGSDSSPNSNNEYHINFDTITYADNTYTLKVYAFDKQQNYVIKTRSITIYNDVDFYAIIVAGCWEARFTNDAKRMYSTLRDHYGFTGEDIILLTPEIEYDDQWNQLTDYLMSESNLDSAIGDIQSISDYNDQVLLYWCGHGYAIDSDEDSDYDEWYVYIDTTEDPDNLLIGSDLDTKLDVITCKEFFMFFGSCFSGGLIGYLDDEQNRAIYTATDEDHGGAAREWGYPEEEQYSFWPYATYLYLDSNERASTADTNSDGRVSLNELFIKCCEYLINRNVLTQNPLYSVGTDFVSDTSLYIGDMYY